MMPFRTLPLQALRLTLLALLLLALLPWGAYARPLGPTEAQVYQGADADAVTISPQGDDRATAARRCRGPALLGSACGPDVDLAAVTALPCDPGQSRPHWPDTTQPFQGVVVFGLTDPPRSC